MPEDNVLVELREVPYNAHIGDLLVTVVHRDRGRLEAPEGWVLCSTRIDPDEVFSLYKSVFYHRVADMNETYTWELHGGSYLSVRQHQF